MGDWLERRRTAVGIGILAVLAILVLLSVLTSGSVPRVLSTVGAAIPPGGGAGGAGGGAEPETRPGPTAAPTSGPEVASADALAPAPGLLIVHTGSLAVRVDAIPAALDQVSAIVTGAGGFVAVSRTGGSGANASASLDLRVPAAAWDRTLTEVRRLGTVLDQQIGSEEVSGQVLDLDARVANLRATEAALQAIMVKATKIPDILDVQEQLTETRGQIEQLSAKAAGLRDRAAFGSLTLKLSVPAPAATPTPIASRPPIWDPGRDAELASGQLVRIAQLGTTGAIWIAIVGVPIVIGLVVGLGVLRLAWLGGRRIARRAAREPV